HARRPPFVPASPSCPAPVRLVPATHPPPGTRRIWGQLVAFEHVPAKRCEPDSCTKNSRTNQGFALCGHFLECATAATFPSVSASGKIAAMSYVEIDACIAKWAHR